MIDFFIGCIARPDPQDNKSPWYTVIGYPKSGGIAYAVSTTGHYTSTKKMDLTVVPHHFMHRIEADVARTLGCDVKVAEKKKGFITDAYCECGGRFDLSKRPPGPHTSDLFAGRVKEYLTDARHIGQILNAVAMETCDVLVNYIPTKSCWGVKIEHVLAYGSLASSVAMCYLAWKEVDYMRGRAVFLPRQTIGLKDGTHGTNTF
jgi:hypothetical protein